MITIEKFESEYNRIKDKLGVEAVKLLDYNKHCENGCSIDYLTRVLKVTYNQAKIAIGATLSTTKGSTVVGKLCVSAVKSG